MQFWIIQAQENPADPRGVAARREWRSNTLAETLADRGHTVIRWRSSFSHQSKTALVENSAKEPVENYFHQFIQSPPYKRHVGLKRMRNHRALGRNFATVANTYNDKPDLIHVGNVPIELCSAAVEFGAAHNIPVIVDVRDLWPDIYADLIPERLSILRKPVRLYIKMFSGRAKAMYRGASAITGLTQSYLNWGLEKADRPQAADDAVFPMCYQKMGSDPSAENVTALRAKLGLSPEDVLACYIGNIGHQSDFETVIAAAKKLQKDAPNLKFVIAGSGPKFDELTALAHTAPNVIMPGWLQSAEVQALMHLSTFGMIAYKNVKNFLLNIPNKYSEYLAGGLVISCGLEGEMGTLTRKHSVGFVYEEGDVDALARQFLHYLSAPDEVAAIQTAARELHHSEFDGNQIYPRFANYLEQLAATKRK